MIEGDGPAPSLVLALVQRLPDDSLTAALMAGDRKLFGWGTDRHLRADIYDALNMNTVSTGSWKKGKTPDIPPWPRPSREGKTAKKKKRTSVADLYGKFTRR